MSLKKKKKLKTVQWIIKENICNTADFGLVSSFNIQTLTGSWHISEYSK